MKFYTCILFNTFSTPINLLLTLAVPLTTDYRDYNPVICALTQFLNHVVVDSSFSCWLHAVCAFRLRLALGLVVDKAGPFTITLRIILVPIPFLSGLPIYKD